MSIEKMIAETVISELESNSKVGKLLTDKLQNLGFEPQTTKIQVRRPHRKTVELNNQHFKFETVLKTAITWANIALVWPAWWGKTTLVENVAKSLTLDFYSKSVSAQTWIHEFFGYMEATWKYIPTLFRKAYEKGWIFLVDEFDAGNPNVLASLNQATANWMCAFPDKMVSKHKDFIIVMAWNTYWTWATAEYVWRNKIDWATLDRFAFIELPYDEKMELTASTNKEWCKYVQKIRKRAETKKVRCIISPRATFMGQDLLKEWIGVEDIKKMLIFKGMSQDEINLIDLSFGTASKKKTTKKPKTEIITDSEYDSMSDLERIQIASEELRRTMLQERVNNF